MVWRLPPALFTAVEPGEAVIALGTTAKRVAFERLLQALKTLTFGDVRADRVIGHVEVPLLLATNDEKLAGLPGRLKINQTSLPLRSSQPYCAMRRVTLESSGDFLPCFQ